MEQLKEQYGIPDYYVKVPENMLLSYSDVPLEYAIWEKGVKEVSGGCIVAANYANSGWQINPFNLRALVTMLLDALSESIENSNKIGPLTQQWISEW